MRHRRLNLTAAAISLNCAQMPQCSRLSISKEKLHSRPTSPFDFWRLDLAGSQFEIGQQLADFALTKLDQSSEREELSGADAEALDEVFETHCPVLSQRAAGVAAQLAKSGVRGEPLHPSHGG